MYIDFTAGEINHAPIRPVYKIKVSARKGVRNKSDALVLNLDVGSSTDIEWYR